MIPLPTLTKENYKVFIYRLADTNADKFIFNDAVKTFLMVSDVRLIYEKDFPAGEVPIFDMAGFSLRHLTKILLPTLKKYMIYTQVSKFIIWTITAAVLIVHWATLKVAQ